VDVFGFAVDAAGDFLKAAGIDAAFELGVFDAVAGGPRSMDELAARGLSVRRLRALLDVLVAINALARVGDRFAAAVVPARPVVARAGWGLMADAIRRDRALEVEGGEALQRYHLHLLEVGKEPARELAAMLPAGSLVDLGGGAGTYTRAYLEAHPDARATIVDFSDVLVLARAVLAEPYRDRVTFAGGEISIVETAGDHDVALLSNVVHLHAPQFCARYVVAAAQHVRPGGLVVIKDLRVDEDRAGPLASLLFALNMAIYTGGGDVYPTSQLRAWLEAAGLVAVEERRLASSPDSIVVIGRKPHVLPRPLRDMLAHAREVAPELAPALDAHYLETMPRLRDAQRHPLLDTRLDWAKLPRLGAALERLFDVLHACEVPGVLGATSAGELRAASPTIAALYARTHYGGSMPLLYGYPADLAYFASRGLDTHAAIDRYLASPILHELCHFGVERDALPMHLDECIAGWLAVHVWPEFAYPAAGHDDAIYAAPWLSQIGQAFARAFGIAPIVRAQAGVIGWRDALPPAVLDRVTRACRDDWARRRTLHFLSDTFDPDPWIALAAPFGDDPAFDRTIVGDALRAMCLANAQVAGSFRTRTVVPESIEIDAIDAQITTAQTGEVDRVAPRYWLPPAVAATIRARGHAGYTLYLGSTEAIPAVVRTVCDGEPPANFVLVPR
jgi:hypothetical protein